MRYTVIWHQVAFDTLSEIWMNAIDREAVTTAANAIDRNLAIDPDQCGEGLNDRRIYVESPLWVVFRIDRAENRVRILKVMYRPGRSA